MISRSVLSPCTGASPIRRSPRWRRPALTSASPTQLPSSDGRRAGGDVAEAAVGGCRHDQLRAVAQAARAVDGAHAHQLQALRRGEARALRERAADEVAALLQQALQAEIIGRGIAVQLRGGDVPFLDAQGVERIESVGADAERRARPPAAPTRRRRRAAPAPRARRRARRRSEMRNTRPAIPAMRAAAGRHERKGRVGRDRGPSTTRAATSRARGPASANCAHWSPTSVSSRRGRGTAVCR